MLVIAVAMAFTACAPDTPEHVHSFGEWKTIKDSTCVELGERKRTCDCGEEESETIPLKSHSFGTWSTEKEASCTEDGEKTRKCSVCNITESERLTKLGHLYDGWLTTDDEHWRVCERCEEETPKSSHVFSDGQCECGYLEPEEFTEGLVFERIEEDGTYKVASYDGTATDVVIPSSYKGKPVTAIAEKLFAEKIVDSVVVPGSIRNMKQAFCESSLKSAIVKNGVESIDENAFGSCTELVSVELPDTLKHIGEKAFYCDAALSGIVLKEGLLTIGDNSFRQCNAITELVVPSTVTKIGALAYANSSGLVTVSVPGSVKEIGDNAFYACTGLESVALGEGVKKLGAGVFMSCTSLQSISMAEGSESFGDYEFYGCTALTELRLPDSLRTIGLQAFAGCTSLVSVKISASLEDWNNYAFYNCKALKNVEFGEGLESIGYGAFYTCVGIENLDLPSTLKSIGDYAFYYCSSVEEVVLPDGVSVIGEYSFGGMTSLSRFVGNGLETIKSFAFYGSSALSDVTVSDKLLTVVVPKTTSPFDDTAWYSAQPDGLVYIGKVLLKVKGSLPSEDLVIKDGTLSIADSAFRKSSVKSISFPSSLKKIGTAAFYDCDSLESVVIPESVDVIGDSAFMMSGGLTSLTLNGGRVIGNHAFDACSKLSTIVWNDDIVSIGDAAFSGCKALSGDLSLSSSVKSVGEQAFYGCIGLNKVTISDGTLEIGSEAFCECSALNEIILPDSLEYVGERAFHDTAWYDALPYDEEIYLNKVFYRYGTQAVDASELKDIEISVAEGTKVVAGEVLKMSSGISGLKSVHIPASVKYVESGAFRNSPYLESITVDPDNENYYAVNNCLIEKATKTLVLGCKNSIIPADGSVVKIGRYAFDGSGVGIIVIPDSVTEIEEGAFRGSRIKGLVAGKGLTSVGSSAFEDCYRLASVDLLSAESLVSIGNNAFKNCYGLLEVSVPASVTTMRKDVFSNCYSLVHIRNLSGKTISSSSTLETEVLTDTTSTYNYALTLDDNGVYTYTVGDEVWFMRYIGNDSVLDLEGYSITGLAAYCLYETAEVECVKLPDTVVEIGTYAAASRKADLEIYFAGDKAKWEAIEKGKKWNFNYGIKVTTVHCQDGDVEITA